MVTISFSTQIAFLFLIIFCRLGAMLMVMPAFGDNRISVRIRLIFALLLTFIMFPLVKNLYQSLPNKFITISVIVFTEITIGIFIGLMVRLITMAIQIAGTVIAFQSGLAFAQNLDPTQGIQSALVGSFMAVLGVTLIFVADIHHILLAAIYDSFHIFKPNSELLLGGLSVLAINFVTKSFVLGLQLSSPFLVFGLVFYMGLGILSRLMPQLQIFFSAMPANIMLGFLLLMLLISSMMVWYLDFFTESINIFLAK